MVAPEEPLLRTFGGVLRAAGDRLLLAFGALRAELPPLRTVGLVRAELPPLRTVGLVRVELPPLRTVGLVPVEVPLLLTEGVPLAEPLEPVVPPPPPGFLTLEDGRVTVVRGGVVVFGGVTVDLEPVGFRPAVGVVAVPLVPVGEVLTVPVVEPDVLGVEAEGLVTVDPLLLVAPLSTPGRRCPVAVGDVPELRPGEKVDGAPDRGTARRV